MSRRLSHFISAACLLALIGLPMLSLALVINIDWFSSLAQKNIGLPILWPSVELWQWYSQWGLSVLYLLIGLIGLIFLRRAFSEIASGDLFTYSIGLNLRRFALLVLIQAVAKPVYFALSSVLLSLNHPAGQKLLSISFGSNELKSIVLVMMIWVISDLMVEANKLKTENQQFV